MAQSRKLSAQYRYSLIWIAVSAADLFVLYYSKYSGQNLHLSNFTLGGIGNLLNLLFALLQISGIIIYTFKSGKSFNTKLCSAYIAAITVLLFIAFLSTKVDLPLPKSYILDHPFKKVFIGFLFTLFQFAQFMFISSLWLLIFSKTQMMPLRVLTNSVIITAVLLGYAFFVVLTGRDSKKIPQSNPGNYNVAVVLGAAVWSHNVPSPSLAARVDRAVRLNRSGKVGLIQLTGSNAPGELSEAEVAYDYLSSLNFDSTKVLMEQNTSSTLEQIKYIKFKLLKRKNIGHIIIVSDSYHLARVKQVCDFFKLKASLAASGLKLGFDNKIFYDVRESVALVVFWLFAL